jgi:hypothetical protein
MVTILNDLGEIEIAAAASEGDQLWLAERELEGATGWALKPEGFCRGEVCVPLPSGREEEFVRDGQADAAALWRHLGGPVLHDGHGTWVLGASAAVRSQRLSSLEAPDFTLPDLEGRSHTLSHHRGKKVFLATWASW